MTLLITPRLRLEPFSDQHLDGLDAMNRLPEAMRYIGGEPAARADTAAMIAHAQRCWAAWGCGWWAFVQPASDRLVGAGCIQHARKALELPVDLESLCRHPHEIGWRLHPDHWYQGLASEAARSMAAFAFERLLAPEIIAICHPDNTASARVAHRLGMSYCGIETWYGTATATHALARGQWLSGCHPSPLALPHRQGGVHR